MKLFELAMLARPLELLLMTAIFVGIAWRALSPQRRPQHDAHAQIPLRDDPVPDRPPQAGEGRVGAFGGRAR
jgi:cbb3-type cytochrome oxidase subunit 3